MPPRKSTEEKTEEKNTLHSNMRFFGQVQDTPNEARKEISAGRLKGYTDINPMWRIKKLTEMFGPAGFGWWTQNEKFVFEEYAKTEEIAVFCQLELIVVDPETKELSRPIMGVGGNKFGVKESKGPYCNDEAMKMAYTDALSIACKALGFSSDIYFAKDRTKYTLPEDEMQKGNDEDVSGLIARIQKGVQVVTKNMDDEAKNKFAKEVIAKHIGSENYLACKDARKLQALLDELLALAKKAA